MSDQDTKIRQDAVSFINNLNKMSHTTQINTLIDLLREHTALSKNDIDMDYTALIDIINTAKKLWVDEPAPSSLVKNFSDKNRAYVELNFGEYNNLCLVKATVSVLNNKECLKKIPKFIHK